MKNLTMLIGAIFIFVILKGQSFDWAIMAGGEGTNQAYAITTDNAGNSYVTGWFSESAHFGDIVLSSEGGKDVFLARYNNNGEVIWAKKAWGPASNTAAGICLDDNGFSIITGWFAGSIHFDDIVLESQGSFDMFVAKFDGEGNVIWAKSAGGEGDDYGNRLTTNPEGDILVSGSFRYTAHFGEEMTLTSEGNRDIFIANYQNNGDFQWVKKAGGKGEDRAYGIVSNNDGAIYFTGVFNGMAFFDEEEVMSNSFLSTYIAKMDAGGNMLWVRKGTGDANDYARGFGIGIDSEGYIYNNGTFSGSLHFGDETVEASGGQFDFDTYLVKYNHEGTLEWLRRSGGYGTDQGREMFTDAQGNSFVTGFFSNAADFGGHMLESIGKSDVFIAKYNWAGEVQWAKRAGGEYLDYGYGISSGNPENNLLYICGNFQEEAFFDDIEITGWASFDMFVASLNYDNDFVAESKNARLSVFPNPSHGTFQLRFKTQQQAITVQIFSMDGKMVFKKHLTGIQNRIKLKTDLATGVYHLHIPELNINSELIIH